MSGDKGQKSAEEQMPADFGNMAVVRAADRPRIDMNALSRIEGVFDSILIRMERQAVVRLAGLSPLMYANVERMMDRRRRIKINPFRDVTVKINGWAWNFGFNILSFCCYSKNIRRDSSHYGMILFKSKKAPLGAGWETKEVIRSTMMGFKPKEIHFDYRNFETNPDFGLPPFWQGKYEHQENHEAFLRSLEPVPGTKTTVTFGCEIAAILDIMKPEEFVLDQPFIANSKAFFGLQEFQWVRKLRIVRFRVDDVFAGHKRQRWEDFCLSPFYKRLEEFTFDGDTDYLPCKDINGFIKVWQSGGGILRKFCMVTKPVKDQNLPQIFYGTENLEIPFEKLPGIMKAAVREELASVDYLDNGICYHVLPSPPKRKMAVVYYCSSLNSTFKGEPSAFFGFHEVDYYPDGL